MEENNNPFKKGSTQYRDFELMKDCEWHCSKCELKSGQAKTWQVWRQEKGIQLDQDDKGNWYKRIKCKYCGEITVHRKLKTVEISMDNLKTRANIPPMLAKRVKKIYGNVDEYTLRTEPSNRLEIDHRIPQVRWTESEGQNKNSMSDIEIKNKFMLLTRENNLLKSRICEQCKLTNKRGKGYKIIEFWYKGNEDWDSETGCEGCFWFSPYEWRKQLNKFIKRVTQNE